MVFSKSKVLLTGGNHTDTYKQVPTRGNALKSIYTSTLKWEHSV